MVPSRSKKTALRKTISSGIMAALPKFRMLCALQDSLRRVKNGINRDTRHATVIYGTFSQKARAAGNRFPDQRKLLRYRRSTLRIGRTENSDHRQAGCGGDVHGPGIISHKN